MGGGVARDVEASRRAVLAGTFQKPFRALRKKLMPLTQSTQSLFPWPGGCALRQRLPSPLPSRPLSSGRFPPSSRDSDSRDQLVPHKWHLSRLAMASAWTSRDPQLGDGKVWFGAMSPRRNTDNGIAVVRATYRSTTVSSLSKGSLDLLF